jgi:hypothetical protein
MTHYKKQLIQIIAFFLIVESVTIGLLFIVPKNKILLIAIALTILITVARSLWNMSPSHIAYIDYDQNILTIPTRKKNINISLSEVNSANWQYKYCRQDKKVSYLDLLKILTSGLFLQYQHSKYSLMSRINKEDYFHLIDHNEAPIVAFNLKKETILIKKDQNKIKINNQEIDITGSTEAIHFDNIKIEQGLFKKRQVTTLPFSWFGGTFKIDKQDIYYEFIRPFEFIN